MMRIYVRALQDDLASFCAEAVRGNNKASETTLATRDLPDVNIISAPDKVKGALDNDSAQGFRRELMRPAGMAAPKKRCKARRALAAWLRDQSAKTDLLRFALSYPAVNPFLLWPG
jgi:hypothetical protein